MTPEPLLSVRGLTTVFRTERGAFPAVDDVSFDVAAGEIVGVVGESGSGKSVTALSIMRLLPDPPGRIARGEIRLAGVDLAARPASAMRRVRGRDIGMIFQEPMSSLNPVFRIGDQIVETILAHQRIGKDEARRRAVAMLDRVGVASAARRLDSYPHEMSGGIRQRVMIAIALACEPKLLIADEPTTALDVTIQAQLLDLLLDLRRDAGMAIMIITHNMGVIAEIADRVIVMYAGRVVEEGPVADVFDAPRHPYTAGLLASRPSIEREEERLRAIPGLAPGPFDALSGCRFAPRCAHRIEACTQAPPPAVTVAPDRRAACLLSPHRDFTADLQ